MYLDLPHPEHKALAERLMAAGVDLVLMHHAHVLQGVELNGLGHACCYSLGNFLCDSLEGNVQSNVMMEEQREGAVFMFDFDSNGLTSIAVLPTWMNDDCHVTWAVGERVMKILQRLGHSRPTTEDRLQTRIRSTTSAAQFRRDAARSFFSRLSRRPAVPSSQFAADSASNTFDKVSATLGVAFYPGIARTKVVLGCQIL